MKLFLISQDSNNDYDTYDSAVVAAEDEATARLMSPAGGMQDWGKAFSSWCIFPERVKVDYIGEAKPDTEQGVICASYNAG